MGAFPSQCLDDDEMLSFVGGELASERRRAVLAHVDECESCQKLAAELAHANDPGPPVTSSKLAPGEVIAGRFVLQQPLGRGATGTVFRAHDRTLGIDVALKLIRRDGTEDGRKSFRRELEVGRRITHRNACRLYDAGSTEQYHYITMELIEGDTLAHVLARGHVTRERALEILAGIAAGLGAAHSIGVVHRDLKPANVMIEKSTERVVLTDFGFATHLDANHSRRLVGTPGYWAPEQARGEPATPACDVYALGVLAYRLLTGEEFSLSDRDALDRVPRDLRKAVGTCVAPRPSDRYADASQAGAALAEAGKPRRRWGLVLAIAALAVGLTWRFTHVVGPPGPSGMQPPVVPPATEADAATIERSPAIAEPPSSSAAPIAPTSASAGVVSPHSGATTATAAHRSNMPPKPSAIVPSGSPSTPPAPVPSEGDLLYRK